MDENYPPAWVRATLDFAILGSLLHQPLHGYGIAVELQAHGMGRPKGGSLYPVLAKLEQDGLVDAVWEPGEGGPGRKAYAITDAGRDHLASTHRRWREFSSVIDHIAQQEA